MHAILLCLAFATTAFASAHPCAHYLSLRSQVDLALQSIRERVELASILGLKFRATESQIAEITARLRQAQVALEETTVTQDIGAIEHLVAESDVATTLRITPISPVRGVNFRARETLRTENDWEIP